LVARYTLLNPVFFITDHTLLLARNCEQFKLHKYESFV